MIVGSLDRHAQLRQVVLHLFQVFRFRHRCRRIFVQQGSALRFITSKVAAVSMFSHNVASSRTNVPVVLGPVTISMTKSVDERMIGRDWGSARSHRGSQGNGDRSLPRRCKWARTTAGERLKSPRIMIQVRSAR